MNNYYYLKFNVCANFLLILSFGILSIFSSQVDYTGYKVIRVLVEDESQMEYIQNIEAQYHESVRRLATLRKIDKYGIAVDWQIGPPYQKAVTEVLRSRKIRYEKKIDDLQRLIDKEKRSVDKRIVRMRRHLDGNEKDPIRTRERIAESLETFLRYDEILDLLRNLVMLKPNLITIMQIGKSFENRSIILAKITNGVDDGSKPAVWVDSGIHAREWLTISTAISFIVKLVTKEDDEDVSFLLDNFVFFFVPVINPDGYEYSHTTDRMWRKTRSTSRRKSKKGCVGVDANRNFDFKWRDCQSQYALDCFRHSRDLCDDGYPGSRAFSELETAAVANFVLGEKDRLKLYFSLHAYSQVWLVPWGYTRVPPDDIDDLVNASQKAVDALTKVNDISFMIGTPCETIGYLASGGSYDWAKGAAGIKYSFTAELRDRGKYGFIAPTSEILPTASETWAGFVALIRAVDEDECWMRGVGCHGDNK